MDIMKIKQITNVHNAMKHVHYVMVMDLIIVKLVTMDGQNILLKIYVRHFAYLNYMLILKQTFVNVNQTTISLM